MTADKKTNFKSCVVMDLPPGPATESIWTGQKNGGEKNGGDKRPKEIEIE